MRSIYFHLVGGASGDMLLSSLIDAGCPFSFLKKEFKKLGVECGVSLKKTKEGRFLKKRLFFEGETQYDYQRLLRIIKKSQLEQSIKEKAIMVYKNIFEVEERLHNLKGGNVYLHRLGEINILLEICGFFVALAFFKAQKIYSSVIPIGNPAPETLELLKGKKVTLAMTEYETITPTAAALLKDAEQLLMPFDFRQYGIGWGRYGKDDYLIAYLCKEESVQDTIIKIETNIDDMNPQGFESLFEVLYAQGAKEVYLEQVMMKKTRPAFVLNVLCTHQDFGRIKKIIFSHTSTFGMRYQEYRRFKVPDSFVYKQTPLGRIKFRVTQEPILKEMPEYEDCLAVARNKKIPLREVYRQIS